MIHLQLVTLTGVKFDEEVAEVLLPTMDGQIGVLTGHMPLITVATEGVISIRHSSKDPDYKLDNYATYGGVIEIFDNKIRVLVDEADSGADINEAEAKKAYDLAIKMKSEAKDEVSLENAQKLVDRQSVRLRVAELHRTKRRN